MKSARAGPLIEAFDVILWRRDSTCRVCSERGGWGPGQGVRRSTDTGPWEGRGWSEQ